MGGKKKLLTGLFYFEAFLSFYRFQAMQRERGWEEAILGRTDNTKRMKRKPKIQAPCASHTIVRLSLMWLLAFHVQIYYAVIIALFFADVSNHYYIFAGISSI